jgi:hypothetical protein
MPVTLIKETKMSDEYRIVTFVVPAGEDLKEFDKWVGSHKWINNKTKISENDLKKLAIWEQICAGVASVCHRYFTADDRVKAVADSANSVAAAKKKVGAQ